LEIPFQLPNTVKERAGGKEHTISFEGLERYRLLVVKDNKVNQKVIQKMLERIGHTVEVAKNGQIALDKLRRASYDLIIMDVQMPIMDGIECTQQICSMLGLGRATLPIIGLTASFQHSALDYYQEIGMTNCLGKPQQMDQLN
jgi:CheY-like chemotaxis protein